MVVLEFVALLRWHFPPFWLLLLAQSNVRHASYHTNRLNYHANLANSALTAWCRTTIGSSNSSSKSGITDMSVGHYPPGHCPPGHCPPQARTSSPSRLRYNRIILLIPKYCLKLLQQQNYGNN